jgi:hypothetical protein
MNRSNHPGVGRGLLQFYLNFAVFKPYCAIVHEPELVILFHGLSLYHFLYESTSIAMVIPATPAP